MEIYANFRQKVRIEPTEVIQKLKEKEIGRKGWIKEDDGKYYWCYEESAGCHYIDRQEEITKEKYDYVMALQLVFITLLNKNKQP